MNTQAFDKAVALAEQRQHLLISTSDPSGFPHIASVGRVRRISEDELALGDCYCPLTLVNLRRNAQITMVVWDVATDLGYQLSGEVEAVTLLDDAGNSVTSLSDGASSIEAVDREMLIRVTKVMNFSHACHSDRQIAGEAQPVLAEHSAAEAGQPCPHWEAGYLYLGQDADL